MAFLLRNEAGNAFRRTDSKVKRDRLVAAGYKDVTPVAQEVENTGANNDLEQTALPKDEEHTTPPEDEEQTTPPKKGKGAGKADKE